jgi:transcriptional regulator with XRE-family HTH domain
LRSLHLSSEGIKKVNLALDAKNMTTERLALELKLAGLYVNKFFRGEAIPTQMFAQICEGLGLSWQELFDKSAPPPPSLNIDNMVQEVRQKCHETLTKRCNRIRILDMHEPRELKEIYTNVNILEDSGQLREKYNLLNDRLKERSGDTTESALGSDTAFSDTSLNTDYDLAIFHNYHLALYMANNPVLHLAGLLENQLRRSHISLNTSTGS